jgi:hypothetical protein
MRWSGKPLGGCHPGLKHPFWLDEIIQLAMMYATVMVIITAKIMIR